MQEHRYYSRELEQKYHDPRNGWKFLSESARKKSVNATIGGVEMLLRPSVLR